MPGSIDGVSFLSPTASPDRVGRSALRLPLWSVPVAAGFPSPADDHLDTLLDLNEHLIQRPAATFFLRVRGDSMTGLGIHDGDLIIVDRSLTPQLGDVVVAALDGDLAVKQLQRRGRRYWLASAHPDYPDFAVGEDGYDAYLWGVVVHAVHHLR
ncbi:MAG: translesion error-prone DNA polymerase V autoproteolytic subunit [Bacteroidota bacterium]